MPGFSKGLITGAGVRGGMRTGEWLKGAARPSHLRRPIATFKLLLAARRPRER
jgi:hypothetical protein